MGSQIILQPAKTLSLYVYTTISMVETGPDPYFC